MTTSTSRRWFGNTALFMLAWSMGAFLPVVTATDTALIARAQGWGVLNLVALPSALGMALSFIALDVFDYWKHRLFHAVPALWRLHALHHSDTDLDVTTTIRHHPLEVLAQALLDACAAIVFGFTPAAVVLYAISASVVQTIQHGNVALPKGLRWIGILIVTPELHRLHHSVATDENNSNFATLFPVWDRLFGTLRLYPRGVLRVGLSEFASAKFQRLDKLLIFPLLVTPLRPLLVNQPPNT